MILPLLALIVFPATAAAVPDNNFTAPISATVTNPCTGEMVLVTGQLHIENTVTINDNTFHAAGTLNTQGVSGVSATGVKYQSTEESSTTFNLTGQAGFDTTLLLYTRLVRQGETSMTTGINGGGDDWYFKSQVHLTVNANGLITAEVDNLSDRCN